MFNIQMNEESGSEVHVEHDELNNEEGLKTESSEDLNEEIAPNETPPEEEKASFTDDPPEVKRTYQSFNS